MPETGPATMETLLPLVWHWLLAYGLALARPLALVSIHPAFTRAQVTGLLRGAVATALCLPALPMLGQALDAGAPSGVALLVLAVKEAAMGAMLGLLLGVPFWALDVAGDLLDLQRGALQGRLDDPAGFEDVSITGTFLLLVGVVLFVASGGLELLADLLYRSWRIWPPLAGLPAMSAATPGLLLGVLDQVLRQAVRLAAPVVLAMLLADFALILAGRAAPQLRVDDQALAARNLVFFLFLPLYCAFLLTYVRQDLALLPGTLDLIGGALPGSGPPGPRP